MFTPWQSISRPSRSGNLVDAEQAKALHISVNQAEQIPDSTDGLPARPSVDSRANLTSELLLY